MKSLICWTHHIYHFVLDAGKSIKETVHSECQRIHIIRRYIAPQEVKWKKGKKLFFFFLVCAFRLKNVLLCTLQNIKVKKKKKLIDEKAATDVENQVFFLFSLSINELVRPCLAPLGPITDHSSDVVCFRGLPVFHLGVGRSRGGVSRSDGRGKKGHQQPRLFYREVRRDFAAVPLHPRNQLHTHRRQQPFLLRFLVHRQSFRR